MSPAFLDTNVILRHLLADHAEQSPKATAYLGRVEQDEIQMYIADTVIFETVFTLERTYHQPKAKIRDAMLPLIELPGVILPGKRHFRRVFDHYVTLNLPFADAYHAVLARRLKADGIVSYDKHFERIPGIKRVEP
jgi:predicted nucleic acid-binding protein